ncbi:N-acetylmuramoyl-L-alanine amidase [bacterium]|nr:N-acetylmuramoyl-L-alanine amidase [bacterium]
MDFNSDKYIDWLLKMVPYDWKPTEDNLKELNENLKKEPIFYPLEIVDKIVIHHAEIESGNRDYYAWFHRGIRGWSDVGYHFIIGNGVDHLSIDGEIEIGRELNIQGAHVKNHNNHTVGICLVGNMDNHKPTDKQMESLLNLLKKLFDRFSLSKESICGHRDFDGVTKSCPGKFIDIEEIKGML